MRLTPTTPPRPLRWLGWPLTALLLVVTLISHEWIELLFKVDPDGGSGELEWLVFAVLLVISLVTFFMARTEWRRAPATA